MDQAITTRRSQQADTIGKGEVFSLLEFAFVPLKHALQKPEFLEKEKFIQWVHINTFDKQWRPFAIGVFKKDERVHPRQWHQIHEVDVAQEEESEITHIIHYFAAWPLQMYIKD